MSETAMDDAPISPGLVGGAAGVVTFGMLASVTVLLFDRIAVAVLVGALSGVGIFYTVPYTIRRADEDYVRDAHRNLARSFHPGAAGYALSGAGVVVLALLFVFESLLLPVAVALTLAMAEYVVLSRVLPRAGESSVEDHEDAWSSDEWDE
ncbi:hypothetical protein HZS55_01150 [Halosimplex rubrum]|uniref:Uncharacterized protein n=1 Tax=Halosimplex rubrum TaxID=869889 RepID=A0A7D5TAX9_9EURY|nr:hypothetical protein [Halosimplex rubrum]QLH75996.1 hypothetical protein HZS55_01150 [Halosimplex rubrum]